MEYFYDGYQDITMLVAGVDTFNDWYGDKAYRQVSLVAEIQSEVIDAVLGELKKRLDGLIASEYAEVHNEWRQGAYAALIELRDLKTEIETKDMSGVIT